MDRPENNQNRHQFMRHQRSFQDRQRTRINLIIDIQNTLEADKDFANIFYLQMIEKKFVYPMMDVRLPKSLNLRRKNQRIMQSRISKK